MSERLSVTQLNRYIAQLFHRDVLLKNMTVEGEISACTYHGSGHIYFTLKDEGAAVSCVMFASDRARLTFRLERGQHVEVKGSVGVFERDGKYQLYAKEITQGGAGKLYEQFLKLKERLEEEGLFADVYKKELPAYAQTIGIVTAPKGAAVRDIIQIAKRRNPFVQLILYPAIVQGPDAAESIVRGLQVLERQGVDLIICGRGGGSVEDLWAFNEEIVARAIFNCGVPVISAVGHETDVTIADFTADLRAPTPSAAAELAVFDVYDVLDDLKGYQESLIRSMQGLIEDAKDRLLAQKKELLYLSPASRIRQMKLRADTQREKLGTVMQERVLREKHLLSVKAERLNGNSPLKRFRAGYGYLTDHAGARVKSVKQIKKDDALKIYLTDGFIDAEAKAVTKRDWEKETSR